MLATFVIGLREGLEAALIVSIVATFLRRNGQPLRAMWVGVLSAIALSIAVGIGLKLVEASLPQTAQEGMETVIGAVAIVFVTGMVLWMHTNARFLKQELETAATDALSQGSARALAVMAFLAVLKEGFETAVFLLATLQSSTSSASAAGGAVLGLVGAAALGFGIYSGGVRINLAKFFSFTSIFLLLVAAGLVSSTLGTAHEAGWLNLGQGKTLDLNWVSPDGSVRGALLTGVFGIPRQPRVVQIIGWVLYIVVIGWRLYAPLRWRAAANKCATYVIVGCISLFGAGALALTNRSDVELPEGPLKLADGAGTVALRGAQLVSPLGVTPLHKRGPESHLGVSATSWEAQMNPDSSLPRTVSLQALSSLNGGNLPVGINPSVAAGPFAVQWGKNDIQVWTVNGHLIDAQSSGPRTLTISGGGMGSSRTLTPTNFAGLKGDTQPLQWKAADAGAAAHQVRMHQESTERHYRWATLVPLLLLGIGALCLGRGIFLRRGGEPSRHTVAVSRVEGRVA